MQIGDKFHRWTVVSDRYKKNQESYNWYVDCICECGTKASVHTSQLTAKKRPSKSCGCLQRETASILKTEVKVGSVFNRLTILEDLGVEGKRRMVKAECSCGTQIKVRYDQLTNDHTKSCGCLYEETRGETNKKHGMCGTGIYSSWQAMKDRCSNPKIPFYENYGGRGIS